MRERERYRNGRDGEVSVEEAKNKRGNGNQNEMDSPNSKQERDGWHAWKGNYIGGREMRQGETGRVQLVKVEGVERERVGEEGERHATTSHLFINPPVWFTRPVIRRLYKWLFHLDSRTKRGLVRLTLYRDLFRTPIIFADSGGTCG